MKDLTENFLELVRLAATELAPDVVKAISEARDNEEDGSAARGAMDTIMKNVEMAKEMSTPICQDTGTPIFYVQYPEGWSTRKLKAQIRDAVAQATKNAKAKAETNSTATTVTERTLLRYFFISQISSKLISC